MILIQIKPLIEALEQNVYIFDKSRKLVFKKVADGVSKFVDYESCLAGTGRWIEIEGYELFVEALSHFEGTTEDFSEGRSLPQVKMAEAFELHVLIVEDSITNQKVLMKFFQELGYKPALAVNGLEAIFQIQEKYYDLIIMDIEMPILGGIEAIRAIRQKLDSSPYIVAFTANQSEELRKQVLRVGANTYLNKPLMEAEFLAEVKSAHDHKLKVSDHKGEKQLYPLNSKKLLSHYSGDEEILESLILDFCGYYESMLQELQNAIDSSEFKEAKRLAHTFKGIFRNFYAPVLEQISYDLEQSFIKEDKQHSRVIYFDLKQKIDDFLGALRSLKLEIQAA